MPKKYEIDTKADVTKKLMANAIIGLADTKPIEKININDICRECGMKRSSFYYHFKDKYELVWWIYEKDHQEIFGYGKKNLLRDEEYSPQDERAAYLQKWTDILKRMMEYRNFYKSAFSDNTQNSLSEYIYRFQKNINTNAIKKHFGTGYIDSRLDFKIENYIWSNLWQIKRWLTGETNYSPQRLAALICDSMPTQLKIAKGIE